MEKEKVNKKLIIIMAVITAIVVGIVVFIVCGGDELIISKVNNENKTSYSNSTSNKNKEKRNTITDNNLNSVNNTINNSNGVNQTNTTNNSNNVNQTNITNNSNNTGRNNTTNTTESSNNSKGTIEWDTRKFSLDGVEYSLGDKYSKFVTNGWKLANLQENYTVPANTTEYKISSLTNQNSSKEVVRAYFKNNTTNVSSINDCQINSIEARSTNSVKFELPGGISLGSSKEDIIKAYGQPTTSTGENNANYHKNTESLRLYFDRNGKLTSAEYSTTR